MINKNIAVIGGGSWATAIVKMLTSNLDNVGWWMRNVYAVEHIKHKKYNPNYLSSAQLEVEKINISTDINKIVEHYNVLVFVVPSAFFKSALQDLIIPIKGKTVFSAIKGIVPDENVIVGEYLNEKYDIPFDDIGVITGPCHAEEVAMGKLSFLTVACQDEYKAKFMANAISSDYIKTILSDDVFGTEYAAVLKNIYAVCAGIARGLNYGDNFQAVLMSNAIREMAKFIQGVHPIKRNINDLAYLGDMLVTGYSNFSRNRMFGNMLGKGYTVKSAQLDMKMIAEGYYATDGITQINKKYNIDIPITQAMYQILYRGKSTKIQMEQLATKLC